MSTVHLRRVVIWSDAPPASPGAVLASRLLYSAPERCAQKVPSQMLRSDVI